MSLFLNRSRTLLGSIWTGIGLWVASFVLAIIMFALLTKQIVSDREAAKGMTKMNGNQLLKASRVIGSGDWPEQAELDGRLGRMKNRLMSHVSHAAVWCSDGRLGQTREKELLGEGRTVDLIARPGAALLLALPESRQSILDEIVTLHKLHGWPEIHLIDHTDCGAYKLQYGDEVSNPDQEYERHYDNLREAAKVVREQPEMKEVTVKCFLYHLGEDRMEEVKID